MRWQEWNKELQIMIKHHSPRYEKLLLHHETFEWNKHNMQVGVEVEPIGESADLADYFKIEKLYGRTNKTR